MLGGVYSNQKCPVCGGKFKDDGKKGLFCPKHPEYLANRFFVRFKGGIFRRFHNYQSAHRFLTGLRYKFDEGSFDARDYLSDNPLGFKNLALQWLEVKRNEVKCSSFNKIRNHIDRAIESWHHTNIKDIGYPQIEEFLLQQKILGEDRAVSSKTRANIKSTLYSFWEWLRKRRILTLAQIPEFPEVPFELGWRNVVDKETQQAVIDEVYRLSSHINIKIWLGIKWLATYFSIRPAELLGSRERDFDLNMGVLVIPHPKEKKPKTVPLLEEDVELLRSLPRGFPDLYFFRHSPGIRGATAGQRFGEKYFYKWWKKACANLGVEKVDLYGGTRHSTSRALRLYHSPEEIMRASMHSTNKAFERYFRIELEDVKKVYRNATKRAAPKLHHNFEQPPKDNLLKFKD